MGDRGEMKNWIVIEGSIKSGVVAKRSFRAHLAGLDISFEDEVHVGGNFEIHRFTLHQLHGFFADESGEQDFIESIGQGSGCRESVGRIATNGHCHWHSFAALIISLPVPRPDLVDLPVHAGRLRVVHLHPVHSQVPLTCVRILRVHARKRNESSTVLRPALENRQIKQGRQRFIR
jgi:hypothetical protein